jgi:hypothetical protein
MSEFKKVAGLLTRRQVLVLRADPNGVKKTPCKVMVNLILTINQSGRKEKSSGRCNVGRGIFEKREMLETLQALKGEAPSPFPVRYIYSSHHAILMHLHTTARRTRTLYCKPLLTISFIGSPWDCNNLLAVTQLKARWQHC